MSSASGDASAVASGEKSSASAVPTFLAEKERFEVPRKKKRPRTESGEGRREPPAKRSRTSVFLGGACNPTTWRRDIAIPLLKDRVNVL